jgi:hypothetical protein
MTGSHSSKAETLLSSQTSTSPVLLRDQRAEALFSWGKGRATVVGVKKGHRGGARMDASGSF